MLVDSCQALLLRENLSNLKCADSVHVGSNERHTRPGLFGIPKSPSPLQADLGPASEARALRPNEDILEVQ